MMSVSLRMPKKRLEFDARLIGTELFCAPKARDTRLYQTAFENGAVSNLSEKEVVNHPYIFSR